MRAIFTNACMGADTVDKKECTVIRKTKSENDSYLVRNELQEEHPCYIICLDDVILWSLLEEIEIII